MPFRDLDVGKRMKYIGKNGELGLVKGKIYNVKVFTRGKYVYIDWGNKHIVCPYSSLKKVLENWEEVKE